MNPKTDGRVDGTMTVTRERAPRTTVKHNLQSGLCAGTIVLTMKGEVPVEHLQAGDRVITRNSGMAVVKAIAKTDCKTDLVTIKAGSLGTTRPDKDMTLAAATQVLIRDWRAEAIFGKDQALVPAARLIDGEFVSKSSSETQTVLYNLQFDAEQIIYADGMEIRCKG